MRSKVNVELTDAEGNARDFDDIVAELSTTTEGLAQAEQMQAAAAIFGNSTVTDDFYKYFGGEDMKGIDVSVHNGDIDWGKVKADGIDFAIIRAGFGRLEKQKDEKFEQNYAGAKAAGIPIGAYWYSYAMTPEEAELEADVFLSVIKGKQFEIYGR